MALHQELGVSRGLATTSCLLSCCQAEGNDGPCGREVSIKGFRKGNVGKILQLKREAAGASRGPQGLLIRFVPECVAEGFPF